MSFLNQSEIFFIIFFAIGIALFFVFLQILYCWTVVTYYELRKENKFENQKEIKQPLKKTT